MEPMRMTKQENSKLQLYANAFSYVPGYLYLLDNNGHLINCNHHLLKQLKLQQLDSHAVGIIYQLMLERAFGNEQQLIQLKKEDIQSMMSEKPQHSETPVPLWLNREKTAWFRISRMPLHDQQGKLEGLLVCLTDVSELQHLQEQQLKLKQELRNANHQSSDAFEFAADSFARDANPRVLLIEDNFLAQKAAKSVLMSGDCDVEVVSGESELKACFQPGKYQLLFMDIGLDGTTGYMLAKEVRKMEQGSPHKVPIIALTGFDAEVVRADCEYYQMEGAIQKPLTSVQVQQIVQHYIKHIDIEIDGLRRGR